MADTKFNLRGVFLFLDCLAEALMTIDDFFPREEPAPPSAWVMFLLRHRLKQLKRVAEIDESELHTYDLVFLLTDTKVLQLREERL